MIIFHFCSSILSDIESNIWTKTGNDLFDVPMGSYMGDNAEMFDLIGLFLLNDPIKLSKSECIGLYRDGGLIVTNRSNC